jgi:hypothetical protein
VNKFDQDVLRLFVLGVAVFVTFMLAGAAWGLGYLLDLATGHF